MKKLHRYIGASRTGISILVPRLPAVVGISILALVLGALTISATPDVSLLQEVGTPESGDDFIALVKPGGGAGKGRKIKIGNLVPKPSDAGLTNDVWIAARSDGKSGDGSQRNPLDGSTQVKFDAIMASYYKAATTNVTFHLAPGVFKTSVVSRSWYALSGWKLIGAGMYETTIQATGSVAGTHYALPVLQGGQYNVTANNVVVSDLTLDASWPALAPSADNLASGSRTVSDAVISSESKLISSATAAFDLTEVGKSLSATGIPPATTIDHFPATKIAGASRGVTLSQATINVENASEFASSGKILVKSSTGFYTVTYRGKTASSFTGCTGGNGTMASGDPVWTETQAVMNKAATATGSSANLTIGAYKNAAIAGIWLYGSYNTIERVRVINTYGYSGSAECFVFLIGGSGSLPVAGAGTAAETSNNIIRFCQAELANGNYCDGLNIDYSTNTRVEFNSIVGYNNGKSRQGWAVGGGAAYTRNLIYSHNRFVDAGDAFYYCDTGDAAGLQINDNVSIRDVFGVQLVADNSGAWTKKNVEIRRNKIGLQNRSQYGVSWFTATGAAMTVSVLSDNVITYDNTGRGLNRPYFVNPATLGNSVVMNNVGIAAPNFTNDAGNVFWDRNTTSSGAPINGCAFSVRLSNGAATSIPDSTWTKLPWGVRDVDLGVNFDNAINYRFTAPTAGNYRFDLAILFDSLNSGNRTIAALYKNGSEFRRLFDSTTGGATCGGGGSIIVQAAANDYFEIFVWQNKGSVAQVEGNIYTTWSGSRL